MMEILEQLIVDERVQLVKPRSADRNSGPVCVDLTNLCNHCTDKIVL